MTKGIRDSLGLPGIDDIINDLPEDIEDADQELVEEIKGYSDVSLPMMDEDGHGASMDIIYKEALAQGRNLIDLGYNIDPARAPRMFEVAGNYLKLAVDAMNSKRDGRLKQLRMLQDQRKLELDEKRIKHEIGDRSGSTLEADSFIVEDRNDIIRRLREQVKSEKDV